MKGKGWREGREEKNALQSVSLCTAKANSPHFSSPFPLPSAIFCVSVPLPLSLSLFVLMVTKFSAPRPHLPSFEAPEKRYLSFLTFSAQPRLQHVGPEGADDATSSSPHLLPAPLAQDHLPSPPSSVGGEGGGGAAAATAAGGGDCGGGGGDRGAAAAVVGAGGGVGAGAQEGAFVLKSKNVFGVFEIRQFCIIVILRLNV